MGVAKAGDRATQQGLLRHFITIRSQRMGSFATVALDNEQERIEGTARYIEEEIAIGQANSAFELSSDLLSEGSIKDTFAFGRFYATGAILTQAIADLYGHRGLEAIQAGDGECDQDEHFGK